MNKLREATFSDASLNDLKSSVSRSKVDIQQKVTKIRVLIRQMKYLAMPYERQPHTVITKTVKLSDNLANFTAVAGSNMKNYLPKILNNESYNMKIVFTTKEEKDKSEKIENQSVQEIKRLTFEMIDELKYKDFLTDMYRKFAKGKDKAAHLEFYHDVADIWHDQDRINTRDDDIEMDS